MTQINITLPDIEQVMEANPLFNLQVKCMALIRMVEEKDAEIASLREQLGIISPKIPPMDT